VSISKSNYFYLVRVGQAINLWVFPLEMNQSLVIVLANSCVLLFVDAMYYSYGVNGKACAEK